MVKYNSDTEGVVQIKKPSKSQLAKQQESQANNQNLQASNKCMENKLYDLRTKLVQALHERAKGLVVVHTADEAIAQARVQAQTLLDTGIPTIDNVVYKLSKGDSLQVDDLTDILEYSASYNDFQLIVDLLQYVYDRGNIHQEHLHEKQDRAVEKLKPFEEREDVRIKAVVDGQVKRANEYARGLMHFFADTEGKSLRELAVELNQQEVPCSKKGARWYPSSVKIVRDRIKELQTLDASSDLENHR